MNPRLRISVPRAQRGISLVIAMLMLAVIGLASAAIMRNATSSDQVATNNRLQTQATQYAQVALRFCENQLTLPGATRSVTSFAAATPPAWMQRAAWTSPGAPGAHRLVGHDIASAIQPRVAPQCLAEATATPDVYIVTARGFSPDFKAATDNGATRSGAVVWLQSTVLVGVAADAGSGGGASGSAAFVIRQRVWQHLMTPPF